MIKKLEYIILTEESLILEFYSGNFNVDELINFKVKIGSDKNYNPNFNVISDIRELEFLFKKREVKKYITFLNENSNHIGYRKTAMVTQTPQQVITSMEFDFNKNTLPINFKVCSSFEAAYNLINLSEDKANLVKSIFLELKSR